MLREVAVRGAIGLIALAGMAPAVAHGAMLATGPHLLHDLPLDISDPAQDAPPTYGLRLDDLFDDVPGVPEDYTFSFDRPGTMVLLDLEPAASPGYYTVEISGTAYGGRDTGSGWANNSRLGFYDIYFFFTVGVTNAIGDDDIIVNPTDYTGQPAGTKNQGWIQPQGGNQIYLTDDVGQDVGISFRLGDEDDDQGHRGYNGFAGWGWLKAGTPPVNHPQSDWLFVVDPQVYVPAPGAIGLSAIACVVAVRKRRPSDRI